MILTLAAYGSQLTLFGIQPVSFLMAMLGVFGGWTIIATIWASLGLTDRSRANMSTYCELTAQYTALEAAHATVCEKAATQEQTANELDLKLALKQFDWHRCELRR